MFAWDGVSRQKLLYELNTSGKYLAFKEQLKHAVVKIVREKYCKTSAFTDRHEFEVRTDREPADTDFP